MNCLFEAITGTMILKTVKPRKSANEKDPAGITGILIIAIITVLAAGCGGSHPPSSNSSVETGCKSIRGEIIEVHEGKYEGGRGNDLGTVLVEGARSSAVEEALLTVTPDSKIIDRRNGSDRKSNFNAISERQTVETDFNIVSSAPDPWRAEVKKMVICP